MQFNTGGVLREEERVAKTPGRCLNANSTAFASVLVAASETADKWITARTTDLVLWQHAATNMPSLVGSLYSEGGDCDQIVKMGFVPIIPPLSAHSTVAHLTSGVLKTR